MEELTIESINSGIEDWLGISDYDNKQDMAWIRRNITALRKQKKNLKTKNNNTIEMVNKKGEN